MASVHIEFNFFMELKNVFLRKEILSTVKVNCKTKTSIFNDAGKALKMSLIIWEL